MRESHWSVRIRNLYGNNQALTGLVETGDLQPLQNLNQLKYLNLTDCENLIGQSVPGFVRAQPDHKAPLFFWDWRHRTHNHSNDLFDANLCGPWTDWVLESTEK